MLEAPVCLWSLFFHHFSKLSFALKRKKTKLLTSHSKVILHSQGGFGRYRLTHHKQFLGGGFKHLFMFTPGEMMKFDDHMFQRGWNHQPVSVSEFVSFITLPPDHSLTGGVCLGKAGLPVDRFTSENSVDRESTWSKTGKLAWDLRKKITHVFFRHREQ